MINPTITTTTDITLITFKKCPSDLNFIADVFKKISSLQVDVDMISIAPPMGLCSPVSFTIADKYLDKVLSFTSELSDTMDIGTTVSSGNCKISVYDPAMKNAPGVAAEVFQAAAQANTDIRLITTSEVEISLLVTAADFQNTLEVLENHFQ